MTSAFPNPWPDDSSFRQSPEPPFPEKDVAPTSITCWRCGKDVPADMPRCSYCEALLAKQSPLELEEQKALNRHAQTLVRLLVIFAALLGTSVMAGLMNTLTTATVPPRSWDMLIRVLILEGVDTVLIFVAWFIANDRFREPRHSLSRRSVAWVFSMPVLAGVLFFNVLYHRLLISWLGLEIIEPAIIRDNTLLTWWAIAICFQPAVMEELFFRYLMFGSLRTVMGGHTVVWVTAVMFAAAHVGVPLSLPVLFVLGVFLGYARLASGSIYLPIILHFLHNACVMTLEGNSIFGF